MRINFTKHKALWQTVFAVCAMLALAGCSKDNYNALLKRGTPEELYQAGLKYFDKEKYDKTIYLLNNVQHYFKGTTRIDTLDYYLASAHYKKGDHEMSGMLLDEFRQTYTISPFLEDVEYMYAKGFYFMSPEPQRDQTNTIRALMAIDEYLERYPESPKKEALMENVEELNRKLHDKAYINARSYYKIGSYKAAVVALKNALNRYPDSEHREELMYLSVKSAYLLAANSLEEKQRERYLNVMDSYYTFVSDYPESKYRKELDKLQENSRTYIARFSDLDPSESPNTLQ